MIWPTFEVLKIGNKLEAMCYHSFLAGSGSSLLGGVGPGGDPAEANSDQSLPGSQKSIRKCMIQNEPRNDDPARDDSVKRDSVYSEPGAVWTRSFPKIPGAAPRCQMRGGDACKPKKWKSVVPKKEFGIDPEEAKENFPEESEDNTSSIPTRHRPGNLLSLGIETDPY